MIIPDAELVPAQGDHEVRSRVLTWRIPCDKMGKSRRTKIGFTSCGRRSERAVETLYPPAHFLSRVMSDRVSGVLFV
jgi:hypothetical protein